MMQALGSQVAAAVMVLSITLGPALLGVWFILSRKRNSRQERRSPLTKNQRYTCAATSVCCLDRGAALKRLDTSAASALPQ